jgi:DNA helicase-2/ATP-dependent DNA helicase PcrA
MLTCAPHLLDNLNPPQHRAVTLGHESALVLAGAGSGKTRVLTTRIAYLIQTGQVSPGGVLAVTFTNKAAKEMLARLSAMLPIDTRGMWVGTFHGLCNRLLRMHHRDARLPQTFQILDSSDQQSAIKRLLKSLRVDEERFKPRELAWFINGAKEQGLRANEVEAADEFTRRQVELYRAYDEQCQKEGVVDFAELLLRCFELLSREPVLLAHYRERFRHILVDEFQDTSRLQYRWIALLAGADAANKAAVFSVGDDDQSIYAFRGADAANMRDFQYDFLGGANGLVIKLEQNYRSHGAILDAANAVIQHNKNRLGKQLWTDAGRGEPIRVYAAPSDDDEAGYILDEVQSLRRGGVALTDIALLYRSNAQSRVLEHALFRAGIAYRVYGGLRFFERQEIKHALAYLRLAANPDDDGAFARVVNFPPRGIGARSVEQVQELAQRYSLSLYAAAAAGIAKGDLAGRAAASIGAFLRIVEGLRAAAQLTLHELTDECLERSGLRAHYRGERDGADRLENLAELVTAAQQFDDEFAGEAPVEASAGTTGTPPADALTAFLTHASLESGENQAGNHEEALQLMTVHAAKGLEFRAVFVSGLEEGLFPHENSLSDLEGIEEERRLMYVAITRARERLYLTYAGQRMLHGQVRYGIVSRFVEEIPAGLCKWIVPPDQQAAYLAGPGGRHVRPSQGARHAAQSPGAHGARVPDYGREGKPDYTRAGFELAKPAEFPFAIGQTVAHAKFGEGVVLRFEGRGLDARIEVKFRDAGVKLLALQYARLSSA